MDEITVETVGTFYALKIPFSKGDTWSQTFTVDRRVRVLCAAAMKPTDRTVEYAWPVCIENIDCKMQMKSAERGLYVLEPGRSFKMERFCSADGTFPEDHALLWVADAGDLE